jgi:hypothetical protein
MPLSLQCSNKGCGKINQPYIDMTDGKVYCSECDGEMTNITPFIKNQMKMNKQFKQKKQTPFAVECKRCRNNDKPLLVNGEVVCAKCKKPLDHLSAPFKMMLKENLKKGSDI